MTVKDFEDEYEVLRCECDWRGCKGWFIREKNPKIGVARILNQQRLVEN